MQDSEFETVKGNVCCLQNDKQSKMYQLPIIFTRKQRACIKQLYTLIIKPYRLVAYQTNLMKMPAHEQEETSVEILNNWESVGLSDEGTFKYVLIEAYASEKLEGTNILASLIMIVDLL